MKRRHKRMGLWAGLALLLAIGVVGLRWGVDAIERAFHPKEYSEYVEYYAGKYAGHCRRKNNYKYSSELSCPKAETAFSVAVVNGKKCFFRSSHYKRKNHYRQSKSTCHKR